MQREHKLLWGARLGVREVGNQESVKYYLEVPLEALQAIQFSINKSCFDPPLQDSIAVMIGYEPRTGATEYHFRQQPLSMTQLDRLFGILAHDEESATMRSGIEQVCSVPLASARQWTSLGYGLAVKAGDTSIPRLTLFLF